MERMDDEIDLDEVRELHAVAGRLGRIVPDRIVLLRVLRAAYQRLEAERSDTAWQGANPQHDLERADIEALARQRGLWTRVKG